MEAVFRKTGIHQCALILFNQIIKSKRGDISFFLNQIGNVGSDFQVNTRFSNDILFLPPSKYGGLNQTSWKETYPGLIIQFAIAIATPEVYNLDPEEVKTLLGVNNIYADTGDVEVTYRADIDLYIAKKIAEGA